MTEKRPVHVWEGVYASFADTAGETTVFDSDIWIGKVVERAQQAIRDSSGGAIPSIANTTDYALPFVAALAVPSVRSLRILDFGGGMGTSYVQLRTMLPRGRAVDFTVVENPAVCRAGEALFAAEEAMRFLTAMPPPPERFDIVHFGSSLHYVEDWKGILAAAVALQPDYILFADLPAADNRTFVTLQNFHERRIPVHFWNVEEFVGYVEGLRYDLVLRSRFLGNRTLSTTNFDDDHRLTYTSQLIFRRAARVTD